MIILAADIGGTYSRFAIFEKCADRCLHLQQTCWLAAGRVDNFRELVIQLRNGELAEGLACCTSVVVAVPGPVLGGEASTLPNLSWSLSISQLRECFPNTLKENVYLVNDCVAHVLACRTTAMSDAICIQPGEKHPTGVVSAIAAGTGFGLCSLIPDSNVLDVIMPSEAGHQDFVFSSDYDRRYEAFLRKKVGEKYLDSNTVVSGPGLALLYSFINGENLMPGEVAQRLTADSKVTNLFATYFGRVARNYALSVLPMGGLYVTGGVAAKNRFLVENHAFLAEFLASRVHHELLKKIPIYLNVNEESGIWGAAHYAVMKSRTRQHER